MTRAPEGQALSRSIEESGRFLCLLMLKNKRIINPRLAGVCLVTRPAGGQRPPYEISQTTGPIFKFQTPLDSLVRELPDHGKKFALEITDDVTGHVKVKHVRLFGIDELGEQNIDVKRKRKSIYWHG